MRRVLIGAHPLKIAGWPIFATASSSLTWHTPWRWASVGNIREDRQFVDDRMHLHKSHDLNSKARHTREMITAFLGRRKRLVWLVGYSYSYYSVTSE
jgi:hypothetical protein